MSRYYYFACDSVLPELVNEQVKGLSINEAINQGIDVDLSMFDANIDRDLPNILLFFNDESELEYPNIYSLDKKALPNEINTTKQFCAALEWSYSESSVDIVFKYIESQLKVSTEVELWSIWLGNDGTVLNQKNEHYYVNKLTKNQLEEFFNSSIDSYCLIIER